MCRLTVASCLFVLTSPVVLVRAASDELMRTVVTREPIVANSPDRGSEAFRGPETLTFTVPPCPDGPAVLTLQYSDRGRTNFMAMVRDGSVCFDTHLCCTNRYLYVSLKLPGQAWDEKTVIRRAEAEFHETAAEALRVELQTGNALHVVRREKSERARVCLRNPKS